MYSCTRTLSTTSSQFYDVLCCQYSNYNNHLAIITPPVRVKERLIINAHLTKLWEEHFCLAIIFSSVRREGDNQSKLCHLKKLSTQLCKGITKLWEVE